MHLNTFYAKFLCAVTNLVCIVHKVTISISRRYVKCKNCMWSVVTQWACDSYLGSVGRKAKNEFVMRGNILAY